MEEQLQRQLENVGGWFAAFAASAVGLFFALFAVFFLVFLIVIWWKIFAKTGNSGFLGLLMFVPLVNFIMLLVLAFSDWPVHRELRMLKAGKTT